MNENNIQYSLIILHETQALMSNSCWRSISLEETSFLEDMEKIQREMGYVTQNEFSLQYYHLNGSHK